MKKYIKPNTEVVEMETLSVIAGSDTLVVNYDTDASGVHIQERRRGGRGDYAE